MCDEIRRLVDDRSNRYQAMAEWWDVGWVAGFRWFLFLAGSGQLREARWCGPRLLPFQTFISLAAAWTRWRLATKDLIARATTSLGSVWWMSLIIESCATSLTNL
jgi:hypothetical protein